MAEHLLRCHRESGSQQQNRRCDPVESGARAFYIPGLQCADNFHIPGLRQAVRCDHAAIANVTALIGLPQGLSANSSYANFLWKCPMIPQARRPAETPLMIQAKWGRPDE